MSLEKEHEFIFGDASIRPFPLLDGYDIPFPYNIILGASFVYGSELEPPFYLTNLKADSERFTITINDKNGKPAGLYSGLPVKHEPVLLKGFNGFSGLMVFGGDADLTLDHTGISFPFNPVTSIMIGGGKVKYKLTVDGISYDMPSKLNIRTYRLIQSASDDKSDNGLLLFRDPSINRDYLKENLTEFSDSRRPITKINTERPNADGTFLIDLTVENKQENEFSGIVPMLRGEIKKGLVMYVRGMSECEDPYRDLTRNIKYSDCGHGSPYAMPLDHSFLFGDEPCESYECD